MTSGMPVKLVLRSTTTQTLSERFTAMHALPHKGDRRLPREEVAALAKAGAKKRRLAEQMPRRSAALGIIDDSDQLAGRLKSVKSRLDVSKLRPTVKDRLGSAGLANGSGVSSPSRYAGLLEEGLLRGRRSGVLGTGRVTANRMPAGSAYLLSRGREYNRGYRASRRGRAGPVARGSAKSRDQLDSELDTYMTAISDSLE